MVDLAVRGALVSVAVALFAMSARAELEPSLVEQDEVVVRSGIPTEDGPMTFVANEGLFSAEGANYTKIFAKRLFGTTLWSHERRLKCYEHVVRVCAQLASVNAQAVAEHRFARMAPWLEGTLESAEALTAFRLLNTNYVPVEYPLDKLRNDLSHALRVISPRSEGGVAFRTTNLERVSQALTMIDWGVTLAGYAYGAAVEHALASDAAFERIDELRAVLDRADASGVQVDPVWFEALDRAAENLSRDETYHGALMGTLLDNRDEIIAKGLVTVYPLVIAHFHEHLEQYVAGWLTKHTAWGATKIAAHASHFGAIWTWSLLATYYTIDGLLDQHERAQSSVAASTLDYLLHEGYEGESSSKHIEPMVLQDQVTYFHKMEQASSGLLTGFHDLISGLLVRERHYASLREHFSRRRVELIAQLCALFPARTPGELREISVAMVWIPPGSFIMGSPEDEIGRWPHEGPQHRVTITSGFWMGKYEVTQEEYEAVMGTNPSYFQGPKRPVEQVSWYDAVEYCNRLSRREGFTECYSGYGDRTRCNWNANGYRLPTEAEWEYACRAGTGTPFYTGTCTAVVGNAPVLNRAGWYIENSRGGTQHVGQKEPNAWGVHDMHGNVMECCWDWYGPYSSGSQTDPRGVATGSERVTRDGNFAVFVRYCRSAFRFWIAPGKSLNGLGFRVVRVQDYR